MSNPNPNHALRILHTADWHLGKRLNDYERYLEFGEFLDWLIDCIIANSVDVLIVAGDIFDTMTPSNKAQELYYQFLAKLNQTPCQHAIIIAGNHDSPSFLDAPKRLFRHFNIYVVGTACQTLSDEIFVLDDKNGNPALIVAAIPYLRERDIRHSTLGESLSEKEQKTAQGIKNHYQTLAQLCKETQNALNAPLPIVATGHLFATGAAVAADDDGMRSLYVGSLGQVGAEVFDGFDYVALGHIHREQMVGKQSHIRYAGSPMAFCFDEENQAKKILLVDFVKDNQTPTITPITLPTFRQLHNITGDWASIENQIIALKHATTNNPPDKAIWLSVECTPAIVNLGDKLTELTDGSHLAVIAHKNKQTTLQRTTLPLQQKSLKELTPKDVFEQFLADTQPHKKDEAPLDDEQKMALMSLYDEIVFGLAHETEKT